MILDSPARPASRGRVRPSVLAESAERRASDLRMELADRSLSELRRAALAAPPPREALRRLTDPGLHLIAEIKRRSPSAGRLVGDHPDLAARARAYEAAGAAAISVLVEPHWFGGSVEDLRLVRAATSLPVLAKEFVVDERQLPLLRAAGADLVLLLAALHPAARLRRLVQQARDLGMESLVEARDERELERTLASDATLVGLNSRDLRTLKVDPDVCARLRADVPEDRLVVAESGIREPTDLARWRALSFDAVLIGGALMAAGESGDEMRARTAAFVAAGAAPGREDPVHADRRPWIKICGVTDRAGALAAVRAEADAVGLNFVPGTPRALSEDEAGDIILSIRAAVPETRRPRLIGILVDPDPHTADALADRLGLDALQLSGEEPPTTVAAVRHPVYKVLRVPPAVRERPDDGSRDDGSPAERLIEKAREYLALDQVAGVILDASMPGQAGGTGRRADPAVAAQVAAQVPVILAGGLGPGSVGQALREIPAIGVDVSSGVEMGRTSESRQPGHAGDAAHIGRPRKDPLRVGLFAKRAFAARIDRPHLRFGPAPVHPGLVEADARGRWGTERQFGGRFVPESLVSTLVDLELAYAALRDDPAFWAELRRLGRHYVGRPSPLYRADRLAGLLEERAGRPPGALRLYLKREDLSHTGAHKINNALGQVLLARRLGRSRIIAETGAGQHGVATATACALMELPCVVYMGAEDIRRQAPNVLRMRALGAEVRPVTSGNGTLKDAVNEAIRDWVASAQTTHYVLGSAVGPHPYPVIVRDLQRVIGDEAVGQLRQLEGRLPDAVVACLGGGSNAIGLFARFIGEPEVRLVGVEAGGEGLSTGRHAAALAGGRPGVLHGALSYLLQDGDGQVIEPHSISAGLDYPGIGPQLSALYAAGRMEVLSATDAEALEALRLTTRAEGILPALEPSHAIAALPRLLTGEGAADPLPPDALVLLGLSGRGDKDLSALDTAES
ncbi:hypothetical protein BH20CHL6_BH20CHL6_13370 [soil metagenome]